MESVEGAGDLRRQQPSQNLAASRYGHRSRLSDVAAADQTGACRLLAASPWRSAHGNQWQTGCNQQHLQGHAEALSRFCRNSHAVQDQRPDTKSWDGSHEKGQFRIFMAELHLWMQAWSDQGGRILVIVLHGTRLQNTRNRSVPGLTTTTNEPLRVVQQVQGQKGFEAWHLIVRRHDQSNTSDRSSGFAALVSNISELDGAKDVEQLDDILQDEQVRRKVCENPRRREDSGSEKVDAREFAELSVVAARSHTKNCSSRWRTSS